MQSRCYRRRCPVNVPRHHSSLTLELGRQSRNGCRRSTHRSPYAQSSSRRRRGLVVGMIDLIPRSSTCPPSCRMPPDRKWYGERCRQRRTQYLSNEARNQTLDVGLRRDRTHLMMTSCRLPLTSLTQQAINISRRCRHRTRMSRN